MRRLLGVLLCAAVGVAGCGGSESSSPRAAVKNWQAALRDPKRDACDLLPWNVQVQLRSAASYPAPTSCEDEMLQEGNATRAIAAERITSITRTSSRALVRIGRGPLAVRIVLVNDGDQWHVMHVGYE